MLAFMREWIDELSEWPDLVTGEDARHFHATSWWLGRRIVGHVHIASAVVDVPFSRAIRDCLLQEQRAMRHRYQPRSGWVSASLNKRVDAAAARWLMRLSYIRVRSRLETPSATWLAHELATLRLSGDLYNLVRAECASSRG
jgi:Luciferase